MSSGQLDRRKVLVTGGTGSVGQAIVRAMSADGYTVDFLYNSAGDTASSLSAETGVRGLQWDLSAASTPDIDYDYDVFVHSAAVLLGKQRVASTTIADYELTMAINVRSAFLLAARCLPHMTAQGWGRVINIGSVYSLRSGGVNLSYNISKHALSGLTKNLAREQAALGITVNEVCPCAVESDIMAQIAHQTTTAGEAPSSEAWLGAIRSANPTGSIPTPGDVAAAVTFLASDSARFVNGCSLVVDGAQFS